MFWLMFYAPRCPLGARRGPDSPPPDPRDVGGLRQAREHGVQGAANRLGYGAGRK